MSSVLCCVVWCSDVLCCVMLFLCVVLYGVVLCAVGCSGVLCAVLFSGVLW